MDVQNQFSHLLVTSFEIVVASTQFLGALVSFSDAEIFKVKKKNEPVFWIAFVLNS